MRNQLQGIALVDGHHVFDPEIGWGYTSQERLEAYAAHQAVGDTHLCLSLDLTGLACLPIIKPKIREAIVNGFSVLLMCMGDGNNEGESGHDPGALGFGWVCQNFGHIYDYLKADEDLTPWIVFCPGFDGVIPAWQPWTRVDDFLSIARKVLNAGGTGYLALELSAGYVTWSGESNDWARVVGQYVDVILQEFPIEWGPPTAPPAHLLLPDGSDWAPSATDDQRAPWTQIWLMERMLGPRYVRPTMEPPNYDKPPLPWHLANGTPRGRFYYIPWEQSTYSWCRQNCDISLVNRQRQVVKDLGAEFY